MTISLHALLAGPLILLSASAVRWLNSNSIVKRDVRQALALASGRVRAYKGPGSGRIPQDVILGFWLAHVPLLRVIEIQAFTAWADKWKFVGDLRSLLIAHRVPWERMAWLTDSTHRLWTSDGAAAVGKLSCAEAVCSAGTCASAPSQSACRMQVSLKSSNAASASPDYGCFACQCWHLEPGSQRQWSNGTCRFLRTSIPRLPHDCWNPTVSTTERK